MVDQSQIIWNAYYKVKVKRANKVQAKRGGVENKENIRS